MVNAALWATRGRDKFLWRWRAEPVIASGFVLCASGAAGVARASGVGVEISFWCLRGRLFMGR